MFAEENKYAIYKLVFFELLNLNGIAAADYNLNAKCKLKT